MRGLWVLVGFGGLTGFWLPWGFGWRDRRQFGRSACGSTPACGSKVGVFDPGFMRPDPKGSGYLFVLVLGVCCYAGWVERERVLPSGSLNQATWVPPGAVQTPASFCSK
jgi:hypothetical protein